jgi:hypothetical protein
VSLRLHRTDTMADGAAADWGQDGFFVERPAYPRNESFGGRTRRAREARAVSEPCR